MRFANDPKNFTFLCGEKIFIEELVDHVKKKADDGGINKGLKHFNAEEKTDTLTVENRATPSKSVIEHKVPNTKTHFFLNKLLSAADRNSKRKKGGYRYDSDIKRYASYLRMIAGPLAYETIQKNLEHSLPSLPSTNRYIQSTNCHIVDGILRSEELLIYLKERNLPLVVSLSEDATRIQGRVQYDSYTNQLVGFTLPLNKRSGMPIPYSYPARNATEICSHFSGENSVSNFLIIVMAQPISVNAKPFCLVAFGSDNSYSAMDVANRWKNMVKELAKLGIKVLTISSDSDPRYNAAMRQLSKLGQKCSAYELFSCDYMSQGPFYVQDTVHIGTKLRNFILRTILNELKLPFGKYFINWNHLNILLKNFAKDTHQLTASVLNPVDRQNFSSVLRMCHPRVIEMLKNVKCSDATSLFLQIMNDIIESFMNQNLTALQRVRKIWYSLFMIRIWRHYIINHKNYTLKDNFLTANCYTCIELNAHSLILSIAHLDKINQPELFTPHLYESQPCEAMFRQFRSFTSTYSTVANCTVKEAESRISKIQLQNDIVHETSSLFHYPRLAKLEAQTVNKSNEKNTLPTNVEIWKEIEQCKRNAIATAFKFGLISNRSEQISFTCKVPPYDSNASKQKLNGKKISGNANATSVIPNLKNVQLKNFADEMKQKDIDETSRFVEIIINSDDKRMVVKKTSLCWLLRSECQRLSSDRLQRVRCSIKDKAKQQNQSNRPKTFRPFKIISKKKKSH